MSQNPDGFVGGWSDACCTCPAKKPACDCAPDQRAKDCAVYCGAACDCDLRTLAPSAEKVEAVLKGGRAC